MQILYYETLLDARYVVDPATVTATRIATTSRFCSWTWFLLVLVGSFCHFEISNDLVEATLSQGFRSIEHPARLRKKKATHFSPLFITSTLLLDLK